MILKKQRLQLLLICILLGSLVGCKANAGSSNSEDITQEVQPKVTTEPIISPVPTVTPIPTVTPVPTDIPLPPGPFVDMVLSDENNLANPNATRETNVLYNFLNETFRNYTISGQQESTWMGSPEYEMNYIEENTGRLPAIRGLDYINEDFNGVTKRAIEWSEKGGIVSICWHWGTPPTGVGYDSSKGTIDVAEALTEGTDLYNGMIAQMDRVAEELKKLQEVGVPVLWRPFHEFDGAWFWWGKGGSENFIKLWQLMYDRYTNYHGLNNLIWVLGYSGEVKDGWYPGDEYVDIIGADNYSPGTHLDKFNKLDTFSDKDMPITYHENGPLPDPDQMQKDGATWSWFLTWHTIHIMEQNTPEYVNTLYNHEFIITLDELPDFDVQ